HPDRHSFPTRLSSDLTFTAMVAATSPGMGTPTGMVTFRDGAAVLGTGTLDSTGRAALSTSTLGSGSHTITAVYSGDTNFTSSTRSEEHTSELQSRGHL